MQRRAVGERWSGDVWGKTNFARAKNLATGKEIAQVFTEKGAKFARPREGYTGRC